MQQRLIKCKTVSDSDHELEDEKEFKKLIDLLPELYPNVYEKCDVKTFDGRGILFHLNGKQENDPAIFMAHYDVVSADEQAWDKPYFYKWQVKFCAR